jgi:TonB family protein
MRPWIAGSVVGHIIVLFGLSALSSFKSEAQDFGDIIRVDLQTLELPVETVVEEPPPEPEEIPIEQPEAEPELPESLPEPEIVPDPVPPTPEMPPEPEVEEEEPDPIEEPLPDLPEPEEIRPESVEPPPELSDPLGEETGEAQTPVEPEVIMSETAGMPDYYRGIVQRKLGQRWDPPASSARGRRGVEAVISFRLGPNGNILDARVLKSSGLSHIDRLALRAVLAADPLPKPPSSYLQAGSLPVESTFSLSQ